MMLCYKYEVSNFPMGYDLRGTRMNLLKCCQLFLDVQSIRRAYSVCYKNNLQLHTMCTFLNKHLCQPNCLQTPNIR